MKQRLYWRLYYENNKYKISKHKMEVYIQREIYRLRKEIPEKVELYFKMYAYDADMERYTRRMLAHFGIVGEKSFYNDCLSNSQMGYLYAVERSAYCGYIGNHVKNYVKFMIRVSIICAINTSNEVRQICKESHLQVVYIDADEYNI